MSNIGQILDNIEISVKSQQADHLGQQTWEKTLKYPWAKILHLRIAEIMFKYEIGQFMSKICIFCSFASVNFCHTYKVKFSLCSCHLNVKILSSLVRHQTCKNAWTRELGSQIFFRKLRKFSKKQWVIKDFFLFAQFYCIL